MSVAFFRFKDTGLQWFFALGGMSFVGRDVVLFVHGWDVVRSDVIIGGIGCPLCAADDESVLIIFSCCRSGFGKVIDSLLHLLRTKGTRSDEQAQD